MLETLAQLGLAMIAISVGVQIALALFIAVGLAWESIASSLREHEQQKKYRQLIDNSPNIEDFWIYRPPYFESEVADD